MELAGCCFWGYSQPRSRSRPGHTRWRAAIVMSWIILGEVPSLIAVLGGALCLVGVYIARKAPAGTRREP